LRYLDETSINLAMTRLYGRAFGGERIIEYVPDFRFERYSLLSTLSVDGDMIPIIYSGTLNGDLFKQYLAQFVVPKLKPYDILVMDCCSAHKVKGVSEMVEAVGANVVYLPQYSPDLNPIETVWPEIKSDLKKAKARTFEAICDAVKSAIEAVSPEHAINHFRNCFCGL
jgi:transposase